jgi:Tol biopolymer transport system component
MRRAAWAVVALLALAACGGETAVTTPSGYTLVATGRAERGLSLHVAVKQGTDSTAVGVANLSVSPADAATVSGTGDILFLKAGPVTITGSGPDGRQITLQVVVATPPLIVFDGLAAGNRDIYRVALDGGSLTRLTTNVANEVHPSAVGDNVVYTSYRDGNGELYSLAISTGVERRRSQTDDAETQVVLAPDGRHVAYARNGSGVNKLWTATIDFSGTALASGAAQLVTTTQNNSFTPEVTPNWGPGSDKLLFVGTTTPSGGAGLFTIPAVTGSVPTLVQGSGGSAAEVEPSWNADGSQIAYASVIAGATEIFVRNVQTSAVTQITHNTGSSGQPVWLSDGRIVFTTFTGSQATLRWVDPTSPLDLHTITTTALSAEHAAAIR